MSKLVSRIYAFFTHKRPTFWYNGGVVGDGNSKQRRTHSGLGVGGAGSYVEPTIIPTIAAIERVERMEKRATYCRKCGQSDVWDGAMFTTGGGDVCDDCYC